MRLFVPLVLGAALALGAVGPLAALPDTAVVQTQLSESQGNPFVLRERLAAGRTLAIRNINGPIKVERADGELVEVTAYRRAGRRGNPEDVRIDVVREDGSLTVCAVYPNFESDRPNTCRFRGGQMNVRDNDTNVEFTVRVPAGVRLSATTVNGAIDIARLASPVEANTVNGAIALVTSGQARATTVNGSISARLEGPRLDEDTRFTTVNGSVSVQIASGTNATVEANTVNGNIEAADFNLFPTGRYGPRRLSGQIGGGGPTLKLSTVNGKIELRRL